MEYKPEWGWLTNACLNLTDACNLECRYCFVEQHPHFMSLETAKKSVEFLIDNLHKKKELGLIGEKDFLTLTYFGGEPMLCYDSIIVPLTTWAKNKYKDEIDFSMTTNGTLLNLERIKWLYDNNFGLLLSIDGDKPTQDYNRPCRDRSLSSFDLIMNNIPYILEYFPNITFRSTIDNDTVAYTFDNFIFAASLGFKHIFMMPNCRTNWTSNQINTLEKEYEKIYDYFIMAMNNEVPYIEYSCLTDSFRDVLIHDVNVINETYGKRKNNRSIHRCGLGTGIGSIGYDGSIYGCQEQDSKINKNIFHIGNIYDGIDSAKHMQLLSSYNKLEEVVCEDLSLCESCPLCNHCSDFLCPSTTWDLFHSFHVDAKIHCQWRQIMFNQACRVMYFLVNTNNLRFKDFFENNCVA